MDILNTAGIEKALGASGGGANANAVFDASAVENALSAPSAITSRSKFVPDSGIALQQTETQRQPSFKEDLFGGLETAASIASGIAAAPIGAATGLYRALTGGKYGTAQGATEASARASEVAEKLTYEPRSQIGRMFLSELGKKFEESKLGGLGPPEAIALSNAIAASPHTPLVAFSDEPQATAKAMGSVGASGVASLEQARAMVSGSHPELIAKVEKAGENVNLDVLKRHVEAASLPEPVYLTTGQATQNVARLSQEQNLRGKFTDIGKRFNEQNEALVKNVDAIRENAAPDVYVTSKPDVGQHVIDAYQARDAAANANIATLYKALEDANGGQFPVDAQALRNTADAALHKNLLYEHLPGEIRRTMDKLGNTMTFEQYEALRTNLARIQRSPTADGNAQAAAGVVRQAMEDLPLLPEAAGLKQLADAARSAARARFAAIEADPAYKAVVAGKASADKFIDKYVVAADTKHVQIMRNNLANDPTAQQALAAGVVDRLKDSGVKSGNFTQAGYNKALDIVRPKLDVLFGHEQKAQLETLGNVARYTQAQPRGSFVNVSNTLTAAIAEQAKETAKSAAEGAVNVAAKGVPLGTWSRMLGRKYFEGTMIKDMLQVGGGLSSR